MSIALPVGKIQTPIFSRDSSSRRKSEISSSANRLSNTKSRSLPHKTLEEANLRIVQYEIAEREACRVIASMCQDGSRMLNNTGTEYEIDDILSGVLVLGNIYKRLGNEKTTLESTIESMRKEHTELETERNFTVERLENTILRLQMENNKLQEHLTEMKLKHNHKIMNAMKEIHEYRDSIEAMKVEKSRLETKIQHQERMLMDVPRMEEQYQRNARQVVRQQEVANTLKEIGWKKLEGEVKSLNFWKSKAKSLEETVANQKAELENLSNQGRLSLSRYQNLLLQYNALKRSRPHEDTTMKAILTSTAPAGLGPGPGQGQGQGTTSPLSPSGAPSHSASSASLHPVPSSASLHHTTSAGGDPRKRPISAPAGRKASTAVTLVDDEALDELFHQHGHQQIGYGRRRPTTAGGALATAAAAATSTGEVNATAGATRGASAGATLSSTGTGTGTGKKPALFKKTLQNLATEELDRLRDIIAKKDEIITRLSRKLSHARAYPLKGIGASTRVYDLEEDSDAAPNRTAASANGTASGPKSGQFDPKSGTKFDEDESETESFKAEEEEFQRRRVEDAQALQKHYSVSAMRARAAQPAHIRAIRESKSFKASDFEGKYLGWEM